jgi:hypothetical protein
MNTAQKIIKDYLSFSGIRSDKQIKDFLTLANTTNVETGSRDYFKIVHIRQQLTIALLKAMSQPTKQINLEILPSAIFNEDRSLGKFTDTGSVPSGGRQDEYWARDETKPTIQFSPENKEVRRGQALPNNFNLNNEKFLLEYFGIRAVEYGQWLTQQDRVNYLAGCSMAMYDLARVLGFRSEQIGLYGLLSIAFGARGRGKALGHFEPDTFAVNMTRFKRPTRVAKRPEQFDRSRLMFFTGGIGTFCHEFGHALDYYGGMFVDPAPLGINPKERYFWSSLSFGRSNRTRPSEGLMRKQTLRGSMERLMNKIIWKSKGQLSSYYKRILEITEQMEQNAGYWVQRNELFARAFEVYVINKLHQRGWENVFLLHYKYDGPMYLTTAEFKAIEHEFDELIRAFRPAIRDGVATPGKFLPYQKIYGERKAKKKEKRKKKAKGKEELTPAKKAVLARKTSKKKAKKK